MKKILVYIRNVYKYINVVSVFFLDVVLDCLDSSLRLWALGTITTSQHSG